MRIVRKGSRAKRRPLFAINDSLFRKLSWGRVKIVSELSGLSFYTVTSWAYSRGKNKRVCATKERAQALADALRVPFERLWFPKQ